MAGAGSVAGHLLKVGSVFAFLAVHRRESFPDADPALRPLITLVNNVLNITLSKET